jgi:hypothetical protein
MLLARRFDCKREIVESLLAACVHDFFKQSKMYPLVTLDCNVSLKRRFCRILSDFFGHFSALLEPFAKLWHQEVVVGEHFVNRNEFVRFGHDIPVCHDDVHVKFGSLFRGRLRKLELVGNRYNLAFGRETLQKKNDNNGHEIDKRRHLRLEAFEVLVASGLPQLFLVRF